MAHKSNTKHKIEVPRSALDKASKGSHNKVVMNFSNARNALAPAQFASKLIQKIESQVVVEQKSEFARALEYLNINPNENSDKLKSLLKVRGMVDRRGAILAKYRAG